MNKDMEVDLIYYELKLQSLLEKFLENGYQIKNDVYFNRLLSFLGGKENKDLAQVLLQLPLISEWILRAIQLWEDKMQTPDHSISAFTLQLLGLISKNETTFNELSKLDIYSRLIVVLKVRNAEATPSVKLGFIKLLAALVTHRSGCEWVLKTTYWQDIINFSLQSQTIYISKEGHYFMASFLNSLAIYNDSICSKIWQSIINPLLIKPDNFLRNQENRFEACDEKIESFIGPTISLMNDILEFFFEKCLEGSCYIKNLKNILQITPIIESVMNYLHIVRNQNLAYEIGRVWILLLYLTVAVESNEGVLKVDIEKELLVPLFLLLSITAETGKTNCVLKFLYFILVHWYKLSSKVKVVYLIESNRKYKFEEQFMFPLLLSNLLFCRATCSNVIQENYFREDYQAKISTKMSKTCIRFGYKWRDSLRPDEVIFNIGPKALSYILQLKPLLSRDSAVLIFQSFLNVLVDLNAMLKKNNNYAPLFAKCEIYIKQLFETLADIIVHFNISWKDSLESLCVFQASVEFLKLAPWPFKIVIADLYLIKTGISNYLSPNFALLIDRGDNCAVSILVKLLYTKLHDPEWSVRDSALEVLSIIAKASNLEFQSFQKVVLSNDLCDLVLSVSLLDGESFVRASALKCLNHLVPVEAFWKSYLENQEVLKKIMMVLKQETEGIVRAEAATLLTTVFKCHGIDPALQTEVYACMCSSAIDDLHWEVRLNSLVFWNDRVEQKLKVQGMVDGEFPTFTFSAESRKIVNLTNSEIKKRVLRVLDQLSEIGCLTVLKHAISDDCDLQVSKKGLEIAKTLVDLMEKYDIFECNSLEEKGPLSNDSCYSSLVPSTPSPSQQSSDDIIEQILGVSDSSLLKDIYNPTENFVVNTNRAEIPRQLVSSNEFIRLTRKNFNSLVSEREKWINSLDSLSSLLNDMLESYEPNDTNAMDCY